MSVIRLSILLGIFLTGALHPAISGYKARPWKLKPAESYPARMDSEGIVIALEPLFLDALAAQVFDKNDIVTRGIMPIGIIIFNRNDFPIRVEGLSAELIRRDDRLRGVAPDSVVQRLFSKKSSSVWIPQPLPRPASKPGPNEEALSDFMHKHLDRKVVPAQGTAGGFLYFPLPHNASQDFLREARLYLPEVFRHDSAEPMIYFEIELAPALPPEP